MKTIVFLEAHKSGSSREAIRAAERLGYYTVLLTNRPSFLEKRSEFPDVHLMRLCNLTDIEEIRNNIKALVLRALGIHSIISFVDPYCHTACLMAEEFGVNRFSTEAILKMQDKILSREVLSQSSYVPKYQVLSDELLMPSIKKAIKNQAKFILKSPNSTGSKDVYVINNHKKLKRYMGVLERKYPGVPILVEEYLDGPQYLVEVVVYQQEIYIIAIIEQEITFNRKFIVTGYSLLIELETDFLHSLREAVYAIVKLHGMETGACHLEMRLVHNEWKLIEINPRISGAGMNRLIEFGFGINLVEQTLKISLGKEPNLLAKYKQPVFAQYVTISETGYLVKVTGKKKTLKCPGVLDVYVKPRKGSLLTPPLSMGDRYAYVMAKGNSEQEAKEYAKHAAAEIQFHLSDNAITQENKKNMLRSETVDYLSEYFMEDDK